MPKTDFDQIRRLSIKLNDIDVKAQAQIAKVQQEEGLEYNAAILELNQISQNIKIAQGVVPAPEVLGGLPAASGQIKATASVANESPAPILSGTPEMESKQSGE